MNRSPLFYPLNRGGDAEAGGAADLQTDVMRFMAILSLCLVAIFALVQSIPLAPSAEVSPPPDVAEVIAETEAAPRPLDSTPEAARRAVVPREATPVKLTRPVPKRTVVREAQVALQRPEAAPVGKTEPRPPNPTVEAPPAAAEPAETGFTLQFETDAALTRLVARQVVGLYAMSPEKSLRMSVEGDNIGFWPASLPAKFHEMDVSTVPDEVLAAYPNENLSAVKWGVTLPADMTLELDGYLASATSGSLVIASNGDIDLRQ